MNKGRSLSSNYGGSSSNALLCLAFFAILAIVIVSVIGFSNCATDNDDGTEGDAQVYFIENSIRYVVLSDNATVGVARNDYGSEVKIPESATDQQTGKSYTVVSIESNAFNGCHNLKTVEIPSTVTNIDPTAFRGCTMFEIKLIDNTSFIFQNGMLIKIDASGWTVVKYNGSGVPARIELDVTAVGDYAFEGTSVTRVDFQSVNKIGMYAFAKCTQLIGVSSDTAITEYGAFAFSGCTALGGCDLDDVNSIPSYLFENCRSLKEAKLPSNLKWIGAGAFSGCTDLASISVPETVQTLNDNVFHNCSALTTFHLHKNLTEVSNTAFLGCSGITSFTVEEGNEKFFAKDDVLYKEESDGTYLFAFPGGKTGSWHFKNVDTYGIAPYAFSSRLVSSFGVDFSHYKGDTIGDYAFAGCTALYNVTNLHSIKTIGAHAFERCENLESVFHLVNPYTPILEKIGDYAFAGCVSLVEFYHVNDGTGFNITTSMKSIADTAFNRCTSLPMFEKLNGPHYKVYNGALYNNDLTKLIQYPLGSKNTSFTLPKETKEISSGAFVGAVNLSTIYVEDGNKSFVAKDGVLYDKEMTTLVSYPANKYADFEIPKGVTFIRDHAFENTKVRSIVFNDVEEIGDYAFHNCTSLTINEFGANVRIIGEYAFCNIWQFEDCTLTLHDKVTSIGNHAFENNKDYLRKVIIEQTAILSFNSTTFKDCGVLEIVVPYIAFIEYMTHESVFCYTNIFYGIVSEPNQTILTYNGEEQSPVDIGVFNISNGPQVNVGIYDSSISPIIEKGYVWDSKLSHEKRYYQWVISPKEVNVEDISGQGKVYDGTTTVLTAPKITMSNVIDKDKEKLNCLGLFSYTSADAGTVHIMATDLVLTGESSSNYKLKIHDFTSVTEYTISRAPLDIGEKSVYYNGGQTFTKEFATGVGTEKVILTYVTSSDRPDTYTWKGADKNFLISYVSPDGKKNYDFRNVGDFRILPKDVTVWLNPNHDGAEVKSVKLNYPYKLTRDDVKDITWENHLNVGWYCENRALLDFDNYEFLENQTIYAKWAEISGSDLNVETDKKNMEITVTDAINKVNVKFMGSEISLDVTGMTGCLQVSLDNSLSNDISRYWLNVIWSTGAAYTGNIGMTIPYDASQGDPVPYYYPASGGKVKLDGTVDKDKGIVTFTAPNCVNAQYGIEYVPAPVPPEPTPTGEDNTALYIAIAIIAILAIIGVGYYCVKKRKA